MHSSAAHASTVDDNRSRYLAGAPHIESWFVRANHPTRPRALWLKATIVGRPDGSATADAWCSLFDGEAPRAKGAKASTPLDAATFEPAQQRVDLAGCRFSFDPDAGAATGEAGPFTWDLKWRRLPGALGAPMSLLPTRRMLDVPIPRNKLLTPAPAIRLTGSVTWAGERWSVDDWLGMQGHNWGQSQSPEYAWGQCHFLDASGTPFATVEGASGRVAIGSWVTPILALMEVRRAGRTYRFDRLVDTWNRRADIRFPDWTLKMRGRDGAALLSMRARPDRMVCLGYENPSGSISHCLNSKLATVSLRVDPIDGPGFECFSEHGGALEFLQPHPEPSLPEVV
ncbi:MAG: hypothetical protein GY913_10165 [Proteobacteria bacterium]|nr:hypothetical protein [Pseudomonadota bacterium]MCP4917277.1 hypothetical protein [Pseudomonadota bacterium]